MIRRLAYRALAFVFFGGVALTILVPLGLMTYVTWRDEVSHTSACGWQR